MEYCVRNGSSTICATMANISSTVCFPPFLDAADYPIGNGYSRGRLCASLGTTIGSLECCLPCPMTDWVYPDNFYSTTRIPGYVSIFSLVLCGFMLLCFVVLPVSKTKRQWLNVSMIISIFIFELGITIPVLARPSRCYDAITPNNDVTDITCAWSGAFLITGGAGMTLWTFARALSMHLLICWNINPTSTYYYSMTAFAWGISAVLLGICMSITGVSSRFGDYCLVNHHKSVDTLWAPLLTFATITMIIQLSTFAYCLHVYLKQLRAVRAPNASSPFGVNAHSQTARIVYQRVKQVVQLQWRPLAIVSIMLIYVIYFSVVFVVLDNISTNHINTPSKLLPWLLCLYATAGDKTQCLPLASAFTVNAATLLASLALFAVIGIVAWVLVGRWEMITGWGEVGRRVVGKGKKDEGMFEIGEVSGRGGVLPLTLQKKEKEGDKRVFEMVRVDECGAGGRGAKLAAVEKSEDGRVAVGTDDDAHVWVVEAPHGFDFGRHRDDGAPASQSLVLEHNKEMEDEEEEEEEEDSEGEESEDSGERPSYSSSAPVTRPSRTRVRTAGTRRAGARTSFASAVVDRGWRA